MVIKILLSRPVLVFSRREDGAIAKSQYVAGKIVFGLHPPGHEDLIFDTYAHQAFVEGPVAQAAEGKAVCGQVVVAFAPGLDVGSLDDRVAVGREHPDPAKGTAVIVYRYNRFPEPLIANSRSSLVFFLLRPP
jgi:hypothetical protein